MSRAFPQLDEFQCGISKDIYVYCGHGSGAKYLPVSVAAIVPIFMYFQGNQVRKLDCNAVVLLMGCSSGLLKPSGEFEPQGMPLKYLTAGAPAVVANLWDVTDRDIDKFTCAILDVFSILYTFKETQLH